MTPDTQTAFVLVPRELADLFVDQDRRYSDEWWNGLERFRDLLSAAPKPPESEIGPVAWRGDAQDEARKFTAIQRVAEIWSEQRLTVQPLYPQARIDADAATIAALRAEVAALKHDVESAGSLRLRLNAYRERAEAAEARVRELESNMDLRDVFIVERGLWADFVAQLPATPRQAALASEKETIDE